MKFSQVPIEGAFLVETAPHVDHRGAFSRFFCEQDLAPILDGRHIVQINYSLTSIVGAVRGLHYQARPHAEMKLIRCLKGRVWDVMVDLRGGSPTFLNWHAEELRSDSMAMLVIPEGCAHGFQVLEPDSELLYLHTAPYTPGSEGGIAPDDPSVGIRWPLPIGDISQRDRQHPHLQPQFSGLVI